MEAYLYKGGGVYYSSKEVQIGEVQWFASYLDSWLNFLQYGPTYHQQWFDKKLDGSIVD